MRTNLNNNALYNIANVLDSVTPATHIVCNNDISSNATRSTRAQTHLNPPESSTLESPEFIGVGDSFFHSGVFL